MQRPVVRCQPDRADCSRHETKIMLAHVSSHSLCACLGPGKQYAQNKLKDKQSPHFCNPNLTSKVMWYVITTHYFQCAFSLRVASSDNVRNMASMRHMQRSMLGKRCLRSKLLSSPECHKAFRLVYRFSFLKLPRPRSAGASWPASYQRCRSPSGARSRTRTAWAPG